jgi:regulator of protease activity HflC (stomatin/prohibitin superfamily)
MLRLITALLGICLVLTAFLFLGWQFGYLALLLLLFWGIWQAPLKYRRRLVLAYLVFVIALLSSTAIHTFWVRSPVIQQTIRRVAVLRLVAGSNVQLAFWALLLGLSLGAALVWAGLQAVLFVSSEFVLGLTTGLKISRTEAMRYLLDLFLQRQMPSLIIEEGRIVTESRPGLLGRLGGPGLLIVRTGNAVVIETADGGYQVFGAGTSTMGRFEKIKQIVDLRPQEDTAVVKDALTKDRIPLAIQLGFSFQIEPQSDTDARPAALEERKHVEGVLADTYPVYKESVFKAVYNAPKEGWQKETCSALMAAVRDVIFERNLDDLYDYPVSLLTETRYPSGRAEQKPLVITKLEEAVQTRLAAAALNWGVKINHVDIATLEMPAEVRQMVLAWWQKKWETAIAKQEADRDADIMMQRAAGRRDALIFESEGEAIARSNWLRQVIQVLLGDNAQLDSQSAVELIGMLLGREKAARALGSGQIAKLEQSVGQLKGEITAKPSEAIANLPSPNRPKEG